MTVKNSDKLENETDQTDECEVEVYPEEHGVLLVRAFEDGSKPDTFWVGADDLETVVKDLHEASYDVKGVDA